jgi:DNA-binding NarL/FixJ family response regulator
MSKKKKRVIIVDDHPMVRERIASLIDQELDLETCGQADDAQTALNMIERLAPDLAIVDITLRGCSGMELLKQIKNHSLGIATLVLSMHEEPLYAERALRAGAGGYITKRESADEIATAIRSVLAGEVYLPQKMVPAVLKRMRSPTREPTESDSGVDLLADRELEIFTLIGRGYTAHEIARFLNIASATVCTYRNRIKEKVGVGTAFELQKYATRWVYENDSR